MTIEKEPKPEFYKPEKEPKPELPSGEARELAELTYEEWQEHLLLFSQVKNKVLKVNNDVCFPLKLEEGESSPLGLFAEAAFSEKPTELPKGKQALEVWPEHKRSAILGRVIFGDKEGRIYRDIDLKGIGHVGNCYIGTRKRKATVSFPGIKWDNTGERYGLLDRDIALFDYQMSELFLQAGIRTHRVLAIIDLAELIIGGRKLSLREAVKEIIIDKDFHPVIEARAFGVKTRIEDIEDIELCDKPSNEQKLLLFKDAKKMVGQELGRKEPFSDEEYLEWFAKTLGRNVGLMHKNGWVHNFLSRHNITLDCRIVDLDSIESIESPTQGSAINDISDAQEAMLSLAESIGLIEKKDKYKKIFTENYNAVLPKEQEK